MFELIEGNWYLIRNEQGANISVQRCIGGKLAGMATVEMIVDMGGTVHNAVVLSSDEYAIVKSKEWNDGWQEGYDACGRGD